MAAGHVRGGPTPGWVRQSACGVLAAVVCALLVGCGESSAVPTEESAHPPSATPASSTGPSPAATPTTNLGDVVWAASGDPVTNAPQDEVVSFSPQSPRISAFMLANGLPAGTTIRADWEYNDTSLDAFSREIVVPTATNRTWLSFHIDRGEAEPWPVGVYDITVSLDGQVARQASVEVAEPA